MNPKAYRLSRRVIPRRYDIKLETSLASDLFQGSVGITLEIAEPGNSIELHARDLHLSNARITSNGSSLEGNVTLDTDREIATIDFGEALPTGDALLEIDFEAKVSEGLVGLYVAEDGPERLMCTMCFATEARSVFPCFDEPTFKAQFGYEITTAAEHVVLANSPLLSITEREGSKKCWAFAPTPPMSTYLVAFAIGDMAGTEEERVGGTPIRVWSLRGKEAMGEFAHSYTTRLLPWYEEYFGLPYHFGKYDQVAVPGFAAGAMENAGLVTFRQRLLLMNPRTASWRQEKSIAHVVAHEFAHMWFGNLATIAWWDDTWLSEAFAEWISHKAVHALTPDYRIWDDFHAQKNLALETDALETTHPIYNAVDTPAEALEMFDTITYQKGCAVLRMLENFLGETAFREGIRSYMTEFAESNATGKDLWRNLQNASDKPVTSIMEGWVTQSGYPIVRVEVPRPESRVKSHSVETRDFGPGTRDSLRISQRRYFSNPRAEDKAQSVWDVPLVVRYEDSSGVHEKRELMRQRDATISLDLSGELRWCYANAGEVGFYRQDPDRTLLEMLLANLGSLTASEQIGLLSDQWALVRNGTHPITQFLNVLSDVAAIDSYSVLESVVGHLRTLERLLESAEDEEATGKFRAWINRLFKRRLDELGLEPGAGEGQERIQLRVHLLDALARMGHDPNTLNRVTERAAREASDPASVDPNLAQIFVSAAAQFGDARLFDKYVEVYKARRESGASPQETTRYLVSFAAFRPPDLVARMLQLLDDKVIPQESVIPGLAQMLELKHAQLQAWDYIKNRWAEIHASGGLGIGHLVESTGHLPASLRGDIVRFFDAHLNGEAQMSYARALENIDQMAELQARVKDDLLGWFHRVNEL